MQAVFDIVDVAPRDGYCSVAKVQRQGIFAANVDLSAGMTWDTGNGSTYIKNPITGASRL